MRTSKMRREIELKKGWVFTGRDGKAVKVDLPHTWNAVDGQDGGNDYYRGTCHYSTTFAAPDLDSKTQRVYLEFQGVNSSAEVVLNGQKVMSHDGGYSTFRADVTEFLTKENKLEVAVDNSVNDRVYPQKADFTFYGGIYRDVLLRIVSNEHFEMDYYGGDGVMVTPTVEGKDGKVHVESFHKAENAKVAVTLIDAQGNPVAKGEGNSSLEPHSEHFPRCRTSGILYAIHKQKDSGAARKWSCNRKTGNPLRKTGSGRSSEKSRRAASTG